MKSSRRKQARKLDANKKIKNQKEDGFQMFPNPPQFLCNFQSKYFQRSSILDR